MKNNIFFLCLFFLFQSYNSFSQFPTQENIGIGNIENASNLPVSNSAIGQNVIGSGKTDNGIVNQGFIQSPNAVIDSLPYYNIGEIPNQIVYQDVSLIFYVWSRDLGINASLSFNTISNAPNGEIKFNSITKRFEFKAEQSDKGSFVGEFKAVFDGDTITQEVTFDIFPDLPPEQTAFGLTPDSNSFPDDTDDIIITSNSLGSNSFNHELRPTSEVSIAGKTLIFDNNLANNLQEYTNKRYDDIERINLFAEKIIIRSPLHFAQTNVHIQTRDLVFEGKEESAHINTQPANPLGTNTGANGLDAGNITVFVENFEVNEPGHRFRLIGGNGSAASNTTKGGAAGNGGNFISNKELSGFVDLAPGSASNSGSSPGNSGQYGRVILKGNKYSWINPYSLRLVISHLRTAYLNGFDLEVKEICDDYIKEIEDYSALSVWDTLNSETKVEILQLNQEMASISQRIASNLDFYGNPAGWVPMLSFEVNKAAFEEEVNKAINVLYFCYWIQKENTSREQKISSLQTARTELEGLLSGYQNDYIQAVTRLPQVESEAQNISAEIKLLISDLEELEALLLERATYITRPKKVSLWRRITRTVGKIAQVVPLYQPALGVIGTGLVKVSETDFSDPWAAIDSLSGVVSDIAKVDWEKSAKDFKGVVDSIKLLNVKHDTVDRIKIAGILLERASPLASDIKNILEKAEETGISSEMVEATLAKLKAESPEYTNLIQRAEILNSEKTQFIQEINSLLQSLSTLGSDIQKSILSIDGMNLQSTNLASVRDLRAMTYTKDMENRVTERLLKYHYYMKKAYEYRLLKPYPADLNLPELFDEYRQIVETDDQGDSVILSQSQFENLKTIYDDVLSTVTSEILDIYNTNAPEISAPLRFSLTKDDISTLNNGEPIILNMVERGMFPAFEENIRIRSLKVSDVEMHFENGQPGSFAFFDVLMEHSGLSRLKKDGETYLFNHYNERNNNPIVWGSRFDGLTRQLDPKEPSPTVASLLFSILNDLNQYSPENHLLYSRPAAWADILITKNDVTSNGVDMILDSITFELIYDFSQLPTSFATLNVTTNDDLRPYITLNREDVNERQDGWGKFNRTFFSSSTGKVNLEAPESYGIWEFDKWTDQFGNEISDRNNIDVSLFSSQTVKANYQLILPELYLPEDTIYLTSNQGSLDVEVLNIGTGEMDWYVSGEENWLTIIGDTTGLNNGIFKIGFDENNTGGTRIQELIVIAPESIDYIDTVYVLQDVVSSTNGVIAKSPKVEIRPNPATNIITIESIGINSVEFRIYDVDGRMMIYKKDGSTVQSINISSLKSGTYLLQCIDESGNSYVERFIKF